MTIEEQLAEALRERDEARAKAETYERDWYAAKADFGTAMGKMRDALRAAEKRELEALAELDEARAEVERLRAEADRWKRSCNVFRERDWPKAFQATVTSLEQEVSDAHEQLAKFRRLSKPWEGTAYRRGAEAMREACARMEPYAYNLDDHLMISKWRSLVRDLPIPEEP